MLGLEEQSFLNLVIALERVTPELGFIVAT
jgi:hypothetical protein